MAHKPLSYTTMEIVDNYFNDLYVRHFVEKN
jgi:hypothetical protein